MSALLNSCSSSSQFQIPQSLSTKNEEYEIQYRQGQQNAYFDWHKDKLKRLADAMSFCGDISKEDSKCVEATYAQLSGYQNGYQNAWNQLSKE